MNNMLSKIKSTKLHAFTINFVIFVVMLLIYKPFFSPDDYMMASTYYGGYTGEYDYHGIYENIIFGKIVVFFQSHFPMFPCYTLILYTLIFISLVLFSYKILEWNNSSIIYIVQIVILFYFAYEGYVAIQFTKVAGLVGATGIMLFFLSNYNFCEKVVGIILFFFSYIIRLEVAQMLIALLSIIVVLYMATSIRRGFFAERKTIARLVIKYVVIISVYLLIPLIPKYSTLEEKNLWIDYWTWNTYRSDVQDYLPEAYGVNRDIYDSVGIDENDIYIWHEWNTDVEALTLEKGKVISSLQDKNTNILNRLLNANFIGFLRDIPLKMLRIDVFTVLVVILLILYIHLKEKKEFLYLLTYSLVPVFILNYYMYISERFFQHRVDVALLYGTTCVLFLVLIERDCQLLSFDKKSLVALILLLTINHNYWQDDYSMVTEEQKKDNYEFYSSVQNDGNIYVCVNKRDNRIARMEAFYALEIIPKGFYKNIIRGYDVYSRYYLGKEGIGYPYTEIVDNSNMFFVMAVDDNNEKQWQVYLTKRNNTEVELQLVKVVNNRKIYRVNSKE